MTGFATEGWPSKHRHYIGFGAASPGLSPLAARIGRPNILITPARILTVFQRGLAEQTSSLHRSGSVALPFCVCVCVCVVCVGRAADIVITSAWILPFFPSPLWYQGLAEQASSLHWLKYCMYVALRANRASIVITLA